MMRPMEISGESLPRERTGRLRQAIFLFAGLFVAAGFALSIPRNASVSSLLSFRGNADDDDSGGAFSDVADQEEESFVSTTKRSAINTLKLPIVPPELSKVNVTSSTANVTLYLHVGPIQAGVPQLFQQLRQLMDPLQQDRLAIVNASSGHEQSLDTKALYADCQSELVSARQRHAKKSFPTFGSPKTLAETLRKSVPCWKGFLDSLDTYRAQGTSVFLSDEQLSQQVITDTYPLDGPAVLDWVALLETVQADWNIVIITNYRRYFDWLPAAKGIDEQVHLEQHTAELPRLARWPRNEGGMLLEPLFPHFIQHAMRKLDVPYTKRIQELYGGFAETRVLDLYASKKQSVRTTLLCEVLTGMTASCEASRQMDVRAKNNNNTDHGAAAVLDLRGEYQWNDFQLFDELVTTAAARNILRHRHITRTAATVTTQYYIEQYLGIHPRRDLPLRCPRPGELARYLQESLRYERDILGDAGGLVDQHKEAFEQQVKDRMFCAMNMRKLFRERSWRSFLRHLTNKSAPRIQAGGEPGPQPSGGIHRWLMSWLRW